MARPMDCGGRRLCWPKPAAPDAKPALPEKDGARPDRRADHGTREIHGRRNGARGMTVTDIGEARRRRDEQRERIQTATRWAFEQMPFTSSVFGGEFEARWPDLSSSERAEVCRGVDSLVAKFEAEADSPLLDYEATMSQLNGREIDRKSVV